MNLIGETIIEKREAAEMGEHDSERNKVLDDYCTGDLERGEVEEQVVTQDLRISFVSLIW